ncbi:MAG: hypothetical protein E7583_08685 [Ruminococcaceae bacterium]|nr:hypothetical protein [Oscillospiraceae bacterium]
MSYKVYPITKTDLFTENYKIKINGKEYLPDTARVSAYPFNRRWPGHQRSIDQTELVNFLSLETDEALEFEIIPKDTFEKVEIRPLTLGIKPEISDGKIRFTLPKAAYFTVEPYGRQNALHIFADPLSDYSDIDKNSPNVIYFGKGEHDVGMIRLESNQTLFIDEGAVVYACIRATDAENIKILGRGILDNSRNKEKIKFEVNAENNNSAVNNAERLHTIQTEYCTNVTIEGITVRDSLVYNIKPVACENLDISNVKIIGNWRYNSDGIDMHNCVNVHINNCFLRTFDDCICVKGFDLFFEDNVMEAANKAMYRNGKSYDAFKNAVVENCVLWNDWGKCLEIGAETKAEEIYNIEFRNCNIIHVTGPVLDCMNVDWADVHDISYHDINVEYDETILQPVIQTSDSHKYVNPDRDYSPALCSSNVIRHFEYSKGSTRLGRNRRITFENVNIFGRQTPKLIFKGFDAEHMCTEITVRNIFQNGKKLEMKDFYTEINEFTENVIIE